MKRLLLLISSLTMMVNIEASHTLAKDTYAIITLYHTEEIIALQDGDSDAETTSESEEDEATKGQAEESQFQRCITWVKSASKRFDDLVTSYLVVDAEESNSEQEIKKTLIYKDVDAFIIKADIELHKIIYYLKTQVSSNKACALLAPPGCAHFHYLKQNLFKEKHIQSFEKHIKEKKENIILNDLRNKELQKLILSFKEVNTFMQYQAPISQDYNEQEDLIGLTLKNLLKKEKEKGCGLKLSPYRNSLNQAKLQELNPAPFKIQRSDRDYILNNTLLTFPFLIILIVNSKKKGKTKHYNFSKNAK